MGKAYKVTVSFLVLRFRSLRPIAFAILLGAQSTVKGVDSSDKRYTVDRKILNCILFVLIKFLLISI